MRWQRLGSGIALGVLAVALVACGGGAAPTSTPTLGVPTPTANVAPTVARTPT